MITDYGQNSSRVPPNFDISRPVFECGIPSSGINSSPCKIRAKYCKNLMKCLSTIPNFIQDLFWHMSFSNKDYKTLEEFTFPGSGSGRGVAPIHWGMGCAIF